MAIGVFGILIAGAFALAAGSIELSREMSGFENRELAKIRFLELCRATFRELPGTARFRLLEGEARGGGHTQILRLVGHPRAFPVGLAASVGEVSASIMPDLTILSSRPDGVGGLMIQLYHLSGEEATRFEEEPTLEGLKEEPLTLLRSIRQIRWRFYDAKNEEWLEVWDEDGRRPRFVEVTLQLVGDQRPYRSVFWVPEALLPQDFQSAPGTPPTENVPAGGNTPGGTANNPAVQIQLPTVKPGP